MSLHPAAEAVAKRFETLNKAFRDGVLKADDSAILREGYATPYGDGLVALGRSNAAIVLPYDKADADDVLGENGVRFVVTVLDEDRDGDVVVPMGRHGEHYQNNPVWFFGHQAWEIPIGSSKKDPTDPTSPVIIDVTPQDIRQVCFFDREDEDADFVYGKVRRGILNATSIAFVPIRARRRGGADEIEEHKARTHHSPLMPPGWLFEEWDHTETSVVGVPSNAGAIRDAYDREKNHISPRLRKGLRVYAAKARGCWGGWCPPSLNTKDTDENGGRGVNTEDWRGSSRLEHPSPSHTTKGEKAIQPRDIKALKEMIALQDSGRDLKNSGSTSVSRLLMEGYVEEVPGEPHLLRVTDSGRRLAATKKDIPPKERWNKSLSSIFDADVHMEDAQAIGASTSYRVASKFLGCQIKDLLQNSNNVPSARMGSFLTGLKHVLAQYRLLEIRNIRDDHGGKDKEAPPVHETIQLNSKQRDSFLVQGTAFYEGVVPVKRGQPVNVRKGSGPHNNYGRRGTEEKFIVKLEPQYHGLSVTVFTKNNPASHTLNQSILDGAWDWASKNNFLKGEAFALSGEFLNRSDEGWDDVILEERNKKAVRRTLDLFNNKGLSFANRGVILTGPPGTGKTLSGRIIRNQAKGTFIWISSRDFHMSGSVGGISSAFSMAKELAPSVIFMEDVDNWLHPTTIDLLKTEMDGISQSKGVLTILTTNFPERLPDALIDRPGRFHDVLEFDLPTADARKTMLRKWLPQATPSSINTAVKKTQGYSGAHVFELARFAETLREHDGLEAQKALEQAINKVEEQRDLITKFQLEGSNYNPLRNRLNTPRYVEQGMKTQKGHKGAKGKCDCDDCSKGKPCPCEGKKGAVERRKYIKHEGSKWIVYSESGKVLGKHDSKEDAQRQLRAVEANKHKDLSTTSGTESRQKAAPEGPYVSDWSSGDWYLITDVQGGQTVWVVVQNGKPRSEGHIFPSKRDALAWLKDNGYHKKKSLSTTSGTEGGYTVDVDDSTSKPDTEGYTTCEECKGTGNCTECEGEGTVGEDKEECPECDGSGNCPKCDGIGLVKKSWTTKMKKQRSALAKQEPVDPSQEQRVRSLAAAANRQFPGLNATFQYMGSQAQGRYGIRVDLDAADLPREVFIDWCQDQGRTATQSTSNPNTFYIKSLSKPNRKTQPTKRKQSRSKGMKTYLVKTAHGYVTKDDDTYSDDEDDAKKFDDEDDAQEAADDEEDGEVEAKEEPPNDVDNEDDENDEDEVPVEDVDEEVTRSEDSPPKHSAMVLAHGYNHMKNYKDYLGGELERMDNPGAKKDIERQILPGVDKLMQKHKDLVDHHHPDHDLDELVKGIEGNMGGGEDLNLQGEQGAVAEGNIPPGDMAGDDTGAGMDQDASTGAEPSPMDRDSDTEEILERYQHPKSKKWLTRRVGTIRRTKSGRLLLVRKKGLLNPGDDDEEDALAPLKALLNPGDEDEEDPLAPLKGLLNPGDDDEEDPMAPLKAIGRIASEAKEAMDDMGSDDEVPKRYKSVLKHHSGRLGTVSKALTNMGKTQRNGGRGSELTDEGSAGNKRPLTEAGQRQGKPPSNGNGTSNGTSKQVSSVVANRIGKLLQKAAQVTGVDIDPESL